MSWKEYMERQDFIGKRCEKFLDLLFVKLRVVPVPKSARIYYCYHQAVMLGYRLAIADIKESIAEKEE